MTDDDKDYDLELTDEEEELYNVIYEAEQDKEDRMLYEILNYGLPPQLVLDIFACRDPFGHYIDASYHIEKFEKIMPRLTYSRIDGKPKHKTFFDDWLKERGYVKR